MLRRVRFFFFLFNCFLFVAVIGGWVNTRVVIRRKKSAEDLQHVFVKPILSAQMPTKFIIEVANSKWKQIESYYQRH